MTVAPLDVRIERWSYETLGPIFATFAQGLFEIARERRLRDLAFVGRDGWFLARVACAARKSFDHPKLSYIRLDRRQARLAAIKTPADVRRLASDIRKTKTFYLTAASIYDYFALDAPTDSVHQPPEIALLQLESRDWPETARAAASARERITPIVMSFDAFVDIGWQGTIGLLLDESVEAHRNTPWLFFARWATLKNARLRPLDEGILADIQKNDSFFHRGAFDLAGFLEPLCKGDPAGLAPEDPGFNDTATFPSAEPARRGIIAYVTEHTERGDVQYQRSHARKNLWCLSYWPPQEAIELATRVAFDHGLDSWAEPVCGPADRVAPWLSPIKWLEGFACPWKGAWAKRTAGAFGALFWLTANFIFASFIGAAVLYVARELIGTQNPMKTDWRKIGTR